MTSHSYQTLWIDGTMPDGTLKGYARQGPWAVWDEFNQMWLVTGLPWHWMARLFAYCHELSARTVLRDRMRALAKLRGVGTLL